MNATPHQENELPIVEIAPAGQPVYSIPFRFRQMENLHILFWLLKDISWCMIWKPLGMFMIFPTLVMAIVFTKRLWNTMSERCHNLAIICWITANSYWMIAEFFHFESELLTGSFTYKHLAVIPFGLGIACLVFYYLLWLPRHRSNDRIA